MRVPDVKYIERWVDSGPLYKLAQEAIAEGVHMRVDEGTDERGFEVAHMFLLLLVLSQHAPWWLPGRNHQTLRYTRVNAERMWVQTEVERPATMAIQEAGKIVWQLTKVTDRALKRLLSMLFVEALRAANDGLLTEHFATSAGELEGLAWRIRVTLEEHRKRRTRAEETREQE